MTGALGVVVNPTAGAGRAKQSGARAIAALAAQGHDVVDLSASGLNAAMASVRQGIVSGISALIVVGGDGMVNLGVNAVASTSLPLGIIAEGTGNDIARGLGLPIRDVRASVRLIDEALSLGSTRAIDALRITDAVHSRMVFWCAGALSVGFDAAVNARTNAMTWPSGRLRYVRALFGELARFRPYGYRVIIDGVASELAATLICVANSKDFGGGMRIAPEAEPDDGVADVVIGGPLSRSALLRLFPKVYRGAHMSHPQVSMTRGRVVVIEPEPGLGQLPPPAMADGEAVGPLPLRCEVVDSAVRVLVSG